MKTRLFARVLTAGVALSVVSTLWAQSPPASRVDQADLDAVYRIKDEGLQRSQVMDTLWTLTDLHGPRLTNSPNIRAAAAWAMTRLREWGITNVRQESWGPFGRGWANDRIIANVTTPQAFPLVAFPRAWTPGTPGLVTGEAIAVAITRPEEFQNWSGKLKGKVVLMGQTPELRPLMTPLGRRLTDQELVDLQTQPVAVGRGGRAGGPPPVVNFPLQRAQFFAREGVLATLEPGSGRNDHGTVLVDNAPAAFRDAKQAPIVPQLTIAAEHYARIARLLARKVPVALELDIRNRFVDDTTDAFNILADLPGSDLSQEVVMLGAHFDSWHAGTGTTDNAVGVAAMMEAVRILQTTGVRLRRTVRLALWTGEEQGLLGSRAYVKERFADPANMKPLPDHARLTAYFNMDNGTGAIRGIYLQGNEAVRPAFTAWMDPLRSLGMTTLSIRTTGNTDHVAFDEVGLPGFQFIQDPIEYATNTHHSNMDVYDRAQAEDLMKNAVIIATFVYQAAARDGLLPRKTLPRPRPAAPAATQ